MKRKSIELIGISGSGKSFTEQEIRIATKNFLKIYNRREIILKFLSRFINLKIKDKLTILYFNLVNIYGRKQIKQLEVKKKLNKTKKYNNSLGNYFRKNYINLCKKLFNKYCLENKKLEKEINLLVKNSRYIKKEDILFWFYELCAARYIFEKTKDKNYIFLNDEGFIPKSFLFFYTKLKDKKKRIFKYLDKISYPDFCILLYKDKKEIFKIHKYRYKYNVQMHLEKKMLVDMFKINKDIEKYLYKKTKIVKVKNNHKILKKLIKIIKSNI